MPMDQGRKGSSLAALRSEAKAAHDQISEFIKDLEQALVRQKQLLERLDQLESSQSAPNTNEELKRTQDHSSETGQKKVIRIINLHSLCSAKHNISPLGNVIILYRSHNS